MIKATELRLGNLVLIDEINELVIDGIGEDEVHLSEGGYIELERIEGIPITDEWLINFGFNVINSKISDNLYILSIQISNNESLDYENQEFFIASISGHSVVTLWNSPKYVHQLQNLYFTLTGEELTIHEQSQQIIESDCTAEYTCQCVDCVTNREIDDEGNWTEDYSHENGNYNNTCHQCNRDFIGHKRRVTCKVCAIPDINPLDYQTIVLGNSNPDERETDDLLLKEALKRFGNS